MAECQSKESQKAKSDETDLIKVEANLLRFPFFALHTKGLRELDGIECVGRRIRDGKAQRLRLSITRNVADSYPGPLSRKVHFALLRMVTECGLPFENPIEFSWRKLSRTMGKGDVLKDNRSAHPEPGDDLVGALEDVNVRELRSAGSPAHQLVTRFHRLWTGGEQYRPIRAELVFARELLGIHSKKKALAMLPVVVKRLKQKFQRLRPLAQQGPTGRKPKRTKRHDGSWRRLNWKRERKQPNPEKKPNARAKRCTNYQLGGTSFQKSTGAGLSHGFWHVTKVWT
jgi:hypothetical protein